MSTELVQGWITITDNPRGTGIGATSGDSYGNKEANVNWSENTKGGVHMTQFLANERTAINASTHAVSAPAAQMTAYNSMVATLKANDNALLTQNLSAKQLPNALLSGSPITAVVPTELPFVYKAPVSDGVYTPPTPQAGTWLDGGDHLSSAENAV